MKLKSFLKLKKKRYDERLKTLYEAQRQCDVNVKEMSKLYGVTEITENQNKNKEMCNIIKERNKIMCNEIKKTIKETSEKTSKLSFTDTLKRNIVMSDKNKQNLLIITGRGNQM